MANPVDKGYRGDGAMLVDEVRFVDRAKHVDEVRFADGVKHVDEVRFVDGVKDVDGVGLLEADGVGMAEVPVDFMKVGAACLGMDETAMLLMPRIGRAELKIAGILIGIDNRSQNIP